MWNNTFEELLLEWATLRQQASTLPIDEALHLIHDWWQRAPITNHTFHIDDVEDWPSPWELLTYDSFCDLAKCVGMCYTILLIEHEEIKSMQVVQTDNYSLLVINDGQYVLNDQPGEITADISGLRIRRSVDMQRLNKKLK